MGARYLTVLSDFLAPYFTTASGGRGGRAGSRGGRGRSNRGVGGGEKGVGGNGGVRTHGGGGGYELGRHSPVLERLTSGS